MKFDYPVTLTPEPEGGFTVTFADIPEAISFGDDTDDALVMANDVLICALETYFDRRITIPLPSKAKKDQPVITLPDSIGIKVLLLNELCVKQVRPVDLARSMQVRPQEVTRLLNLKHATKVDTIAKAFEALGKSLQFTIA